MKRQRLHADAHSLRPRYARSDPLIPARTRHQKDSRYGWLTNGELLDAAEEAGFDLLLTTNKNMRYQQDLVGRRLATIVIGNAQWPVLRLHVRRVVAAVISATAGSYTEVDIPARH